MQPSVLNLINLYVTENLEFLKAFTFANNCVPGHTLSSDMKALPISSLHGLQRKITAF